MRVFLIQHTPTPHINEFLDSLKKEEIFYNVFYAADVNNRQNDNQIKYYKYDLDFKFIKEIISIKESVIIITGWMNINMIILNLYFFFFQKQFFYWSDRPKPSLSKLKSLKRKIYLNILKFSKVKVLAVGDFAVSYFLEKDFKKNRIINFPICVNSNSNILSLEQKINWRTSHFKGIEIDDFVISAGSRLEFEKGYDIMIKEFSKLNQHIKKNVKILLIGEGSEKKNLISMTNDLKISENIFFLGWKDIDSYKDIIASSDLFIHPARYDAYGASIYAFASGVPVLATLNSGATIDRLKHSFNGFIFDDKIDGDMSKYIELLYNDRRMLNNLSQYAYVDSKTNQPIKLVIKLKDTWENLI